MKPDCLYPNKTKDVNNIVQKNMSKSDVNCDS